MAGPLPSRTPEYLAESLGPQLIATASVFIVLSTVFVALRYYARYLTQTKFGLEDIITPFAWLAEVGLCITAIVMVTNASAGRHMDYVLTTHPTHLPPFFKGVLIAEILHLPAVAFPKLCIILLYLRVFTNKYARLATWALIYVVAGTWIAYTVAAGFQCRPFAFNWDKTIPGGKCFDVTAFALSSSVPNIVSDVAILVLPVRTILEVKVSVGKRVGLSLIFLTGSVGIIASIIRTVVFANSTSNIQAMSDITWTYIALINWTIIEPGMYLLAACALSFKPLFRMLAKSLHLDSILTHTGSGSGSGSTGPKKSSDSASSEGSSNGSGGRMGGRLSVVEIRNPQVVRKNQESEKEKGEGERGFSIVVTRTMTMDVEARGAGVEKEWEGDGYVRQNIFGGDGKRGFF